MKIGVVRAHAHMGEEMREIRWVVLGLRGSRIYLESSGTLL